MIPRPTSATGREGSCCYYYYCGNIIATIRTTISSSIRNGCNSSSNSRRVQHLHHHQHHQHHNQQYLFLSSSSSTRRVVWKILLVVITVLLVWKEQVTGGKRNQIIAANSNVMSSSSSSLSETSDSSSSATRVDKNESQSRMKYVLPTVQLIGIQKGGTSALAVWLFYNGEFGHAFVHQGEPFYYDKEPHFFDLPRRYKQGVEFYATRFINTTTTTTSTFTTADSSSGTSSRRRQSYVMDATPDTFQVPERVKATYLEADDGGDQLQNLKIMVILREPIARELSLYNHLSCQYLQYKKDDPSKITRWHRKIEKPKTTETKTNSKKDRNDNDNDNDNDNEDGTSMIMSFDEYVDTYTIPALRDGQLDKPDTTWQASSRHGLYAHYLSKWFATFERRQILVMSYDELVHEPDTLQKRIKQFLQLDEEDITPGKFMSNVNSFADIPSCKMKLSNVSSETMDKLKSAFEPLNEELYTLLESNPGPSMEQRPFPKFKPV